MSQIICTQCGAELRPETALYVGDEAVRPVQKRTPLSAVTAVSASGARTMPEMRESLCVKPVTIRTIPAASDVAA